MIAVSGGWKGGAAVHFLQGSAFCSPDALHPLGPTCKATKSSPAVRGSQFHPCTQAVHKDPTEKKKNNESRDG